MRLFYDVYYPLLRTFIPVAVEGMLDYKANMELYLEKNIKMRGNIPILQWKNFYGFLNFHEKMKSSRV